MADQDKWWKRCRDLEAVPVLAAIWNAVMLVTSSMWDVNKQLRLAQTPNTV